MTLHVSKYCYLYNLLDVTRGQCRDLREQYLYNYEKRELFAGYNPSWHYLVMSPVSLLGMIYVGLDMTFRGIFIYPKLFSGFTFAASIITSVYNARRCCACESQTS